MKFKDYLRKIPTYLLIVFTAVLILMVIYYSAVLSKQFVNSDIFDTLTWAKASYESGKLLSPDFNYSAILPFGGSLLMLPFIPLFGVSFTTHAIGLVLFEILFFVAIILFAKKVGFSSNWIMIFICTMCGVWLSSDKFREMFCEHIIYYSLSVLFILLGYVIIESFSNSLQNSNRKKSIISGIILALFFFFVGLDGFQIVALSGLSLVAGFLLERFFDFSKPFFSKDNKNLILSSVSVLVAMACGFVALRIFASGISSGYSEGYSIYDSSESILNWVEKLRSFIVEYFSLFEVVFTDNTPLSDMSQVPTLIRLAFAGVIFFTLPLNAILYRRTESVHIKQFFWVSLSVSAVTMAVWFLGVAWGTNWRLIPMVIVSLILLILDVEYLYKKANIKRVSVVVVVLMLLYTLSSFNYIIAYSGNHEKYGNYNNIIENTLEQNITHGYAEYWSAITLEVMTNQQLKVNHADFVDQMKIDLYYYQHFNYEYDEINPDEPCFLIINTSSVKDFESSESFKKVQPYLTGEFDEGKEFWYKVYYFSKDIYSIIGATDN